jgi:hypothetical protein
MTSNETVTPETGAPAASVTITVGGDGTAVSGRPVWRLAEVISRCAAGAVPSPQEARTSDPRAASARRALWGLVDKCGARKAMLAGAYRLFDGTTSRARLRVRGGGYAS